MPRRSLSDRVTDSFRAITELDLSHAYERQAGTITIGVLLVIGLGFVLATRGGRGGAGETVEVAVEAPASGGVARGDPVVVHGVRVGRVERVRLVEAGRVEILIAVERAFAPRRDASAEVVALDLVGSGAVSYLPGTAEEPLADGMPVPAGTAATLHAQVADLRDRAAATAAGLAHFDPAVFRADVARIDSTLVDLRASVAAFPADAMRTSLTALMKDADSVVASLDRLKVAFPAEALAARRDTLAANASELMNDVGQVQAILGSIRSRIAAGEGNLGRFRQDSTLQREVDAARASLRALREKYTGRSPADTL